MSRVSSPDREALGQAAFRLGDWLVEPRLNRLTRGDESIQIELKVMDVLVCLAEHAGELVERQQLIDTVWATEFISESLVSHAVSVIRNVLGDDARNPSFIETIHRRGYRLIVPVEVVVSEEAATAKVARFPIPEQRIEPGRSPYPGLAAFTEEDAEFFFGREAEVARMWRKLTSRRLLAVIGPSGVGKSSFLRAGVVPAKPEEWGVLVCQPGEAPFAALARAMVPMFGGDGEAIARLVGLQEPGETVAMISRWRQHHGQALLIVDQFEELLTLNPREVQASFAELLRRAVDEADVHVLLSMRDDFLYRCHDLEPLAPVFEDLTPVKTPTSEALHRALVEPARRLGFAFEDDGLPEEMVSAVEGERGALPMVAFAIASLWERRDVEHELLTRQAYADLGGVGGALAQHAEATLKTIGDERLPIVREIFRNLVTAEGTRAVREWDELLSVFADKRRSDAEDVLRLLIDARLLTSFEEEAVEGDRRRRVEVVHESLLANWPRLVRWQTQDADAARMRDELRQAARTWDEHGRHPDRLWSGAAFREFASWSERYPGGLTNTEDAYAKAMTAHARRRRRRRRIGAGATFVVLLAVVAIIGGFWRNSIAKARHAEAASLYSSAKSLLDEHPTGAIAYAIASLELADTREARRLALEALWRGPTELRLATRSPFSVDFSRDGAWMATAGRFTGGKLWPSDGGPATVPEENDIPKEIRISPKSDLVAATMDSERRTLGLWSFPEGRFLRSFDLGDRGATYWFGFSVDGERLLTSTSVVTGQGRGLQVEVRSWPVDGGEPRLLASLDLPLSSTFVDTKVDPTGTHLSWADGRKVFVARLEGRTPRLESATWVEHEHAIKGHFFDNTGRRMATADAAGVIRVWSLERDQPELMRTLRGERGEGSTRIAFDPSGSILAGKGGILWDLAERPEIEPLRVRRSGNSGHALAFDPTGKWLVTSTLWTSVSLWSLAGEYPRILRGHQEAVKGVAFTPDGERLVSSSYDGSVRVWPLARASGEGASVLYHAEGVEPYGLAMAPDGSFVVVGTIVGRVMVLPLDHGPTRELKGFTGVIMAIDVGPHSRLVAVGSGAYIREEAVVRVWNLESEESLTLDAGDGKAIRGLEFTGDGDLWVRSGSKLRRWRLDWEQPSIVDDVDLSQSPFASDTLSDLDPDGPRALFWRGDRLWIRDLRTHESRELTARVGSDDWYSLAADGEIVLSGDTQGGVWVGTATGGEPHFLPGHEGGVTAVAVSPDGRWMATGGKDSTIRLWPMPALSKPPLQTFPGEEFIAKLKTLTNLRAVRDEASSTGWKLEVGPFPGWETVPVW